MKTERTSVPGFGFLKGGFRQPFILLLFFLALLALVWPLRLHLLVSGARSLTTYRLLNLVSTAEEFLLLVVGLLLYSLYYRGSPYYLFGRLRSVAIDLLVLPAILAGGGYVLPLLLGSISSAFEAPSYSKGSLTAFFIPGDLPGMWLALIEDGCDSAFQEVLFRGLIMGSLLALTRSPWIAIVAQASLFAVGHGLSFAPYYLGVGLVLGFIAFIRRSLWPVLVFHVLTNAIVFFEYPDPDFNLALRTLQWLGLLK